MIKLCGLLVLVIQALVIGPVAYSEQGLRFSADHHRAIPIPPYRWYNSCTQSHRGFSNELYKRLAMDMQRSALFVEAEYASSTRELLMAAEALVEQGKVDIGFSIPIFFRKIKKLSTVSRKYFLSKRYCYFP